MTMHTVEFMGYFIHQYTGKERCNVQLDHYREFKNLRAAKIGIGKHIRKLNDKAVAKAAQSNA